MELGIVRGVSLDAAPSLGKMQASGHHIDAEELPVAIFHTFDNYKCQSRLVGSLKEWVRILICCEKEC